MEDIEIIESFQDLQKKLEWLEKTREIEHLSKAEEMRILLAEMDSVLKERSDSERSYNAVRRKMEKSLQECQDMIDKLGRDLKASERAIVKVRGDLKASQERVLMLEERNTKTFIAAQDEKTSLDEKIQDLMEKYSKLQKLYDDDKQKSQKSIENLKDYVQHLEIQIKQERAKNSQIEAKERTIQQLKADHTKELLRIKADHKQVIDTLKEEHQIVVDEIRLKEEALRRMVAEATQVTTGIQQKRLLALSSSSSQSSTSSEEDEEEEGYDNVGTHESINDEEKQISRDFQDLKNRVCQRSNLETQAQQIKKLSDKVEECENLIKTIDIDTYLNQIENQVDEMHVKNLFTPRNDLLKQHLELTLRGIRQMCDYHHIDMEYSI